MLHLPRCRAGAESPPPNPQRSLARRPPPPGLFFWPSRALRRELATVNETPLHPAEPDCEPSDDETDFGSSFAGHIRRRTQGSCPPTLWPRCQHPRDGRQRRGSAPASRPRPQPTISEPRHHARAAPSTPCVRALAPSTPCGRCAGECEMIGDTIAGDRPIEAYRRGSRHHPRRSVSPLHEPARTRGSRSGRSRQERKLFRDLTNAKEFHFALAR